MIDKLDVRIPAEAPFNKSFLVGAELNRGLPIFGFRPSRFYMLSGDLRPYGTEAALHLWYRFPSAPHHKIELMDVGTKKFSSLLAVIAEIFDIDPLTAGVMRLDLAADIHGVSVPWFRNHAHFKFKQFSSRIEKGQPAEELEFIQMASAIAQTLYAGKRPNLMRIYDKRHELWLQWRARVRDIERFNKAMTRVGLSERQIELHRCALPTFEEFCRRSGLALSGGEVVTRIERQMGGGRIPPHLATVGALRSLPSFDPFEYLQIIPAQDSPVSRPPPPGTRGDYSARDWLARIGLETLCHEMGTQSTFALVTRHANGNGKRLLEQLCAFSRSDSEHPSVTAAQITARFHQSVAGQLDCSRHDTG